jgi:NAD(P)-dependent dehydrogenase (short-subunit alcohol dehydrogenase family)
LTYVRRIVADISIKEEVVSLTERIALQEPNGIQLLVNNAGIALDNGTRFAENGQPCMDDAQAISQHFMRSYPDDWSRSFETNVMGGFFMSMALLPLLEKGSGIVKGYSSSIVNLSSNSAFLKDSCRGYISYAASKAATVHMSRMLAFLLSRTRVRVNQIAPGTFPSEVWAALIEGSLYRLTNSDDDWILRSRSKVHHEPSRGERCTYVRFPFGCYISTMSLMPRRASRWGDGHCCFGTTSRKCRRQFLQSSDLVP